MKKSVTIKDIAKEVIMSVSTVSRALNGCGDLSKETRDKILQVAQEMGYIRNEAATNLRQGRRKVIGVIVPDMQESFFYFIFKEIQRELNAIGWNVLVAFTDDNAEVERRCLQFMFEKNVDGIIMGVCDAYANTAFIQSLIDKNIPFVFFDRLPFGIKAPMVNIDNEKAVFSITELLIEEGYKHIAHIKAPHKFLYAEERYRGFRQAMEKVSHYDDSLVFEAKELSMEVGASLADVIIEKLDTIDAIVACDDAIALGLMHELQKRGFNIPRDVAITGVGGSFIARYVLPELTTIEYPLAEIGKQAAKMIINKMDGDIDDVCVNFQYKIVERESTKLL